MAWIIVQIRTPLNPGDESLGFADFPEVFGLFNRVELAEEGIEQQELECTYPPSSEFQISEITEPSFLVGK